MIMATKFQAHVPRAPELVCDVIAGGKEEMQCSFCGYVIHIPYHISCCKRHLCKKCLDQIQKSTKTSGVKCCPYCKSKTFTTPFNQFLQSEINFLKVHCPNFGSGCVWEGRLNEAAEHVAVGSRSQEKCQYQNVKCKYPSCKSTPLRKDLLLHESEDCQFRPYECKYCLDFNDTYEKVTTQHYLVCNKYPVDCPNGCGCEPMPRCSVKGHCSIKCPLQKIPCDYCSAGCTFVKARKNMDAHYKADHLQHSSLLAKQNTTLQAQLAETQQKLEGMVRQQAEQESRFEDLLFRHQDQLSSLQSNLNTVIKKTNSNYLEVSKEVKEIKTETIHKMNVERRELKAETGEMSKEIKELRTKMSDINQEKKELKTKMGDVNKEIKELKTKTATTEKSTLNVHQDLQYVEKCITPVPPFSFAVSLFKERKFNEEVFVSPAFYTHPRGYKMCVQVDLHGANNHVAVHCCVMKGEHDEKLPWPFRGIICISIENQLGIHGRSKKVINFNYTAGVKKSSRVVIGDNSHLHGLQQLILHQELGLDMDTCSKGNTLDFVIVKVERFV